VWPGNRPPTELHSDFDILAVAESGRGTVLTKAQWASCIRTSTCATCDVSPVTHIDTAKTTCLGAIYFGRWDTAFELCEQRKPKGPTMVATGPNTIWVTSPTEVDIEVKCNETTETRLQGISPKWLETLENVAWKPTPKPVGLRAHDNHQVHKVLGGKIIDVPHGCRAVGGGLEYRPRPEVQLATKLVKAPNFKGWVEADPAPVNTLNTRKLDDIIEEMSTATDTTERQEEGWNTSTIISVAAAASAVALAAASLMVMMYICCKSRVWEI